MKKSVIAISALVAAVVFASACKKDQTAGNKPTGGGSNLVLAKIGGFEIKESDVNVLLDKKVQQMEAAQGPVSEDDKIRLKKRVLDYMVNIKIVEMEAQKQGIVITDADIDQAVNEKIEQIGGQSKVDEFLQRMNINMEMFRDQIRQIVLLEKLRNKVTESIVETTEEEAKAFYTASPQMFDMPESVEASHILIRVEKTASQEQKDAAKKKIEDLLKQARAKDADFAALAKQYSEDPSAARNNGSLGSFKRGMMVPEFEEVAFKLAEGKISDIVETQFGYHIIKVEKHNKAGVRTFEEVKADLVRYLTDKKREEAFGKYMEEAKTKTEITYPNPLPEPPPAAPSFHGGQPGMGGTPPPGGGNPHGAMPKAAPGTANPHGSTPPGGMPPSHP